jgi:hypothetical protein
MAERERRRAELAAEARRLAQDPAYARGRRRLPSSWRRCVVRGDLDGDRTAAPSRGVQRGRRYAVVVRRGRRTRARPAGSAADDGRAATVRGRVAACVDLDSPDVVSDETTAPIAHEYSLRCGAEHAFAVYTERIGEWWDPRYTANAETLQTVTIEPRVGGRVYAVHGDLGEDDWGEVIVWEPGRRLVHTFSLAQARGTPARSRWSSCRVGLRPRRTAAARCASPTVAGRRQTSRHGRSSGTGASCSTGSPRSPSRAADRQALGSPLFAIPSFSA